jgi:adenine-specific DNA-methyltransferase
MSNYNQLKDVLNDIFELNKADLDFGIYRIMNQKRKQVNEFIEKHLPEDIRQALSETQSTDKTEIENELKTLKKNLDDAGIVAEESPKYNTLKERLQSVQNTDVLEQEVFSHLANFFKRYYKDGDFISMRRYKKDVYAIPYEGEEVKLHWANHDQYYIKSSENFKNYSFKTPDGKTVNFQLKEVSTEQNNNKTQGDAERRFAIYKELPVEEIDGVLNINFVYEIFPKSITQENLKLDAYKEILEFLPESFNSILQRYLNLKGEGRKRKVKIDGKEKEIDVDLLYNHIDSYISKNSFDYFIHKDLDGFLSRELDFYIKNEVLYLDDINTKQGDFFLAQLSKVKAIKVVANKIITFLAQIENFQRKLWLKKKFVVKTDYCITLDKIPSNYFSEILENNAQLEEWKTLFDIEIQNVEQLVFENYLVLDTKFFNESFKDRLLAEFDELESQINGLLMNSDNFHSLNLLQDKFYQKIDACHIDPPYNTSTSGFLYKNSFEHSSWLSMMRDRINLTTSLLNEAGDFTCHIDENEYERLKLIFEMEDLISGGTIIWDKKNPMLGRKGIATQHEYIIWSTKYDAPIYGRSEAILLIQQKAKEFISKHKGVNELSRAEFSKWVSANSDLSGGEKAYKYLDENGEVYRLVAMGAPEKRTDPKYHIPIKHPITGLDCPVPPNGWSRSPETLNDLIADNMIVFGKNESTQPQKKVYFREDSNKQITSVYGDGKSGKVYVEPLGLEFPYCHPVSLYEHILSAKDNSALVIDYFAGSGTTGHAVIKLNREDNGNRKYILVEMGSYFNSVTKPRIQKVIYSDNWKNGKPQDKSGISQIVKYQVLESYEDTLNNLYLENKTELDFTGKAKEEYILQYMLELESREHLFNLQMFRKPFDYQLKVTENNELKPTKVDLVETFNYLIGLYVSKVQRVKDIKVVEGTTRTGIKTLVIWRDLDTTNHDEVEKLLRRFYDSQRTKEFQQIYINGDHHLENLRSEGDSFKIKLIEETFFKKMFNETDL